MADEPRVKRPHTRYYVVGDTIEMRQTGQEPVVVDFAPSDATMRALAIEGAISMHIRSKEATLADIVAGKHELDRSPPVVRVAGSGGRKSSKLLTAIASVKAAKDIRAAKSAGERPTKDQLAEFNTAAMAWVRGQPKEAIASLAKHTDVMIEMAKLNGDSASFEDLLAAG